MTTLKTLIELKIQISNLEQVVIQPPKPKFQLTKQVGALNIWQDKLVQNKL